MTEVETLKAQIARQNALIERLTALVLAGESPVSAPAPTPAPTPEPAAPAKPAREPVAKLTDYGHGRRAAEINGTLVTVAWNATSKVWDYSCGKRAGTAASRGLAFEAVNKLTAKAGLGQVRA